MSISNDIRCKLERAIVRALIQSCASAGFVPHSVDDGGDEDVRVKNEDEAFDAVFSVDESRIRFRAESDKRKVPKVHSVLLIGGNGEDIISDWHCGDASFDAAVGAVAYNVQDLIAVNLGTFAPCTVDSAEGLKCRRPAGHKHEADSHGDKHETGGPEYKRW